MARSHDRYGPILLLRRSLLAAGSAGAIVAAVVSPARAHAAASQAWSPFVLVAGLLMVGLVAHADGLFEWAARRIARLPVGGPSLLVVLLALVAVVTVLLNLDTSVAFLTPVLILAPGAEEAAFLYGALLMSNSASLLLPGSNLTNLLVLAREHVSGALFAARMLPAWLAAVATTMVVLLVVQRRTSGGAVRELNPGYAPPVGRLAVVATAAAATLVLVLRNAALPVLVVGAAAVLVRTAQRRLTTADVFEALSPAVLVGPFGLVVALGTLARSWDGPTKLLHSAGGWETAAIGTAGAVVLNNLPAAVIFSARPPLHPRALLLGLNLGPNLAVTGSLSALLWYQAAKRAGASPSLRRVTRIGVVLVPLSIAAAGLALKLFAPQHL